MSAGMAYSHPQQTASRASGRVTAADFTVMIGRILLAAIFLVSGPHHFARTTIAYAEQQGVPFSNVLVPLSGVMAMLGGLMVLLGFRARAGAVLLVLFLVPVTLMMHQFWAATDPAQAQMQYGNFMKNMGLLGGALLMLSYGPGAISFDRH